MSHETNSNKIAHSRTMTNQTVSTQKSYPCPQCQKPTVWQDNPFKPFCSDRCKLIDLGAWANEDYRVAAYDSPFSQEID